MFSFWGCGLFSLLNKLSFGRILISEAGSFSHQPQFFWQLPGFPLCVAKELASWLQTTYVGIWFNPHPDMYKTISEIFRKFDARIKQGCYSSTLFHPPSKELCYVRVPKQRKRRAGVLCRTSISPLCTQRDISHLWLTSANVSICKDAPRHESVERKAISNGGNLFLLLLHSEKCLPSCPNILRISDMYIWTLLSDSNCTWGQYIKGPNNYKNSFLV